MSMMFFHPSPQSTFVNCPCISAILLSDIVFGSVICIRGGGKEGPKFLHKPIAKRKEEDYMQFRFIFNSKLKIAV